MSKLLWIGDLHLNDREMTSTKGMVANNKVMLDQIYQTVLSDEDILIVLFAGDIQHRTPQKLKMAYEWRQWFKQLGELMRERWDDVGYQPLIIDRDETTLNADDIHSPIFSVRGNHDWEIRQRRRDDFTFFDELLTEELLHNPLVIEDEYTLIELRNYGEGQQEVLLTDSQLGKFQIIALHNLVYHSQSKRYIELIKDTQPEQAYSIETVYRTQTSGPQLLLQGHIHDPEDMVELTLNGHMVYHYQTGSLARTSTGGSNMRDTGRVVKVQLPDDTVTEMGRPEVETIELNLVPQSEYFDLQSIIKRQQMEEDYSDFNLSMGEYETSQYNIRDSILQMEDIDPRVREVALTLVDKHM